MSTPDWMQAKQKQPAFGSEASDDRAIAELFRPFYEAGFFIRVLAWVNIIVGGLYCLTIIGAIVGWLPLWTGIILNNGCNQIRDGIERGQRESLLKGVKNYALYLKILGILTVVSLVIGVMYLGFLFLMLIFIGVNGVGR